MNLVVLNRAIKQLCKDVEELNSCPKDWTKLSEEMLFYEVGVCTFSSQMLFDLAVAMADRLKDQGLFQKASVTEDFEQYRKRLKNAFVKPIELWTNNTKRKVMPRLRNRLPALLLATAQTIYCNDSSIKDILYSAKGASHARQLLIRAIVGFGPKQASLFLRRIGYCTELAVLDTHIMSYLKLSNRFDLKPYRLTRLKTYEDVEAEFKRISEGFGHSVGCVDLATWITMRVAKREYSV